MATRAAECALAICVAVPALAEVTIARQESPGISRDLLFYSNEGDEYALERNANGARLTSKYPKSWFHGEPSDDHQVIAKHAVIYLGNDCDALHNEYGKGIWSGANGGFGASFGGHAIHFDRQELFGDQFAQCYGAKTDG